MKVGDLVRVKNSTTGDSPEMVRLYRERTPLLLIAINPHGTPEWAVVLDGGIRRQVKTYRVEVISEARRS